MDIELWIVALRVLAVLLIISVFWPGVLAPQRWWARAGEKAETRRVAK